MRQAKPSARVGMLLLPGFALTSFALATEAFRTINRQADQELYRCIQCSIDGEPVTSSDGTTINPHVAMDQCQDLDMLFVCAYANAAHFNDSRVRQWLIWQSRRRIAIGAFSSGSFILARYGLLDDHVCTIHWDDADAFREIYPHIQLTDNVYEVSGLRYTCAGGTAAVDLLLHLVRMLHGDGLAADVADEFIIERTRQAGEPQVLHRKQRRQAVSPALDQAVQLMHQAVENPADLEQIAEAAGVSSRQLGRLFHRHLGMAPGQYYRMLRLRKARRLLEKSDLTITQVSVACGFSSASYFSQCYQRQYGENPGLTRKAAL